MNKAEIVAEIGINHNASFNTLIDTTDMAFEAGADYVKLQLRTPELCVPQEYWDTPKMWFDGEVIPYILYRKRMELPFYGSDKTLEDYARYVRETWGRKRWFASVWDIPSLKKLMEFDVPYIKIPSAMITNKKLLRAARNTGKHIILSTGMSTINEIEDAVYTFNDSLTVLHCNSAYPTDDKEVDLNAMVLMRYMFGDKYTFGFSSHSKSPFPPIYAIVLGASMIEVHVTMDRAMQGSDHAASLERPGLELVTRERDRIPTIMGDAEIKVYDSELPAKKKLRG